MKKSNKKILIYLICPILFLGILFSCQKDDINFNQTNELNGKIKFILDADTKSIIIEEEDPQILALMYDNLINSNQNLKAEQLKATYDFTSGKLTDQALKSELYKTSIIKKTVNSLVICSGTRYRAHVQNLGWLEYQCYQVLAGDGGVAGTTGRGLRMEALNISNPNITYRGHVQDTGWQSWVTGADFSESFVGSYAGTIAKSKRLEAVELIIPENSNPYTVQTYYRAHVKNLGWMPWVKSGMTGTTGQGLSMEAFQMKRNFF